MDACTVKPGTLKPGALNSSTVESSTLNRCTWCGDDSLYCQYHDDEWGYPQRNDEKLFEFLILEGAQAGLSWITVLRKRENYRKAYDNFDAEKMARYDDKKVKLLLADAGIIRNRLKIASAINNAQRYCDLKDRGINFSEYIWSFVDQKPIQNTFKNSEQIPATSALSDQMSKVLKKEGFNFIGSTICYAYMQAAGMVNDHLQSCFRFEDCSLAGN